MELNTKISELREFLGKEITSFYLVSEKELREGKNDYFLRLRLQDNSGNLNAYIWKDAQKEADNFSEGEGVKVRATVTIYK